MGPKATPAKQGTLFSYFSKSPAVKPTKENTQDVLSPKRSPNQTKKSDLANGNQATKGIQKEDLVWAKLEGYPWWPSLVCDHPTANTFYKGGKNPQVHVQFFDDPISRSWIKEKNVKPFTGNDKDFKRGGPYYSTSPPVINGVEEAEKALKLPREERLSLVVELQPSEDEEEEQDEMDLDPDIFDAEMSDENNESKENVDVDKKPSKKTPSKSPRKGRRPQRNRAKRRRIVMDDSDEEGADTSEDEFKLDPKDKSDDDSCSSGVDEDDVTSASGSEPNSPVKLPSKRKRSEAKPSWGPKTARKPRPNTQKTLAGFSKVNCEENEDIGSPKVSKLKNEEKEDIGSPKVSKLKSEENEVITSPKVSLSTKSKLASFTASDSAGTSTDSQDDKIVYQHFKYDWLQQDKLKDASKRCKTDPDYDPRTLYIPDQEKTKFTPAMRQWWEIKCQHFDTVLFFKMGKFYELFHMDAVIAVNELGLIYMKGDYAHSGFPEIAYGRYADTLVQKGYKVARIEQTETPDMMTERCKNMPGNPSKFDKVVKREVCRVTTRGTKTFSFLSGECTDSESSYLLSLAEKETGTEGCSTYGVCFVDTSIGKFYIGQFDDDRHCSRLRTVLAHYPPVQVLFERGKLTTKTNQLLSTNLSSALKEALSPRTEFWDSGKTLRVLSEEAYFKENEDADVQWPQVIKKMISENDALCRTASDEYTLAVSSLGALTWYLQFCLLDEELLSMKNFELYEPLDNLSENQTKRTAGHDFSNKHMVLDGVTLANLDVTENSSTGTLEGTLLQRLDHCSTAFGKRLFRQWLCAPLCNPASINDRLDAVEDLIGCQDVVAEIIEIMKKLPDLERLLSRIHTLGTAKSKKNPESRAIFYEDLTYSKRKIEDFLATLDGFKTAKKIVNKFTSSIENFSSQLLKKTVGLKSEDGYFPDLSEDLKYFEQSFDHNKAKKDGVIIPNKGVDTDYDEAVSDMKSTENKLQAYLDKQRQRLGCRSMVYWGTAKNRFQMEIPESAIRNIPNEYQLMSSKKGAKRYRTSEIEELLAQMVDAEERKDSALKDVMRRIFHSFDERYKKWDSAVQCLSVLDVLLCLSQYSRCGDGPLCRPEVVVPSADQQPFLEIRDARHPCICRTFSGGDFIPNDTVIGVKDENDMEADDNQSNSQVVLVTGPNMGGKSTLMRQVGLVVIMAQMGCYVPAEKCRLTPVDRVFTRLGASDRIMSGESTFFVELSETSSILQHATVHSLVLVDELGRGTATYDGTAIACAVVQELSQNLRCRTLFSTHYHSLVEEFSHDPNIRLGHMACMVENEDTDDPSQETITFLYKFSSGACPKSYGFNAARLANLPEEVIKSAVQKSREFEESQNQIRKFKSIWKNPSKTSLQSVMAVS